MEKKTFIVTFNNNGKKQKIGKKAENLHYLQKLNVKIPVTYVINWEAYNHYLNNHIWIIDALRTEIQKKIPLDRPYVIRSSANFEDGNDHSFAGQFKSCLNVKGADKILQAVWSIWATANSELMQDYLKKINVPHSNLKMAVIIQEMVTPVYSGVAFSKNPITGMDEIIIEAVQGPGTLLMQDGQTPLRWVYKWGNWIVEPKENTLHADVIERITQKAKSLAKRTKKDIDLEWVFDGKEVFWVQMREITSIAEVDIYSNTISREQLPGIIKPLIWSVNIPLVNGAWIKLLSEIIGKNDLEPEALAKSFYYRAYYNMGTMGRIFEGMGFQRETIEVMMGMDKEEKTMPSFKPNIKIMKLLPNLIKFMIDKLRFKRKIEKHLPDLEAAYQHIHRQEIKSLSDQEILHNLKRIFSINQEAAYFNIVGPLLMMFYNGTLRSQLRKIGFNYKDLDMQPNLEELKKFSPTLHMDQLYEQFNTLPSLQKEAVRKADGYEDFKAIPEIESFKKSVDNFIHHFGHLSDSGNDFSRPPWRETSDMILRMIIDYVPPESQPEERFKFESIPLKRLHAWSLNHIYQRARQFNMYRERISFVYTYGYGLFRNYYLEIGQRLMTSGFLKVQDDIFYLYQQEIEEIMEGVSSAEDVQNRVAKRKSEIEQYRTVILPTTIYGDTPPPIENPDQDKLRGTPTSYGYYTGPVKVVNSLSDFSKLTKGDVLVVPYSDVSWTPLFSRAGGVVAESGGMLSHSSIIAREYRIPAVVAVPNATSILKDDSEVTIDGYKGEVIIHS
jgi:pyruvate,water dikinase